MKKQIGLSEFRSEFHNYDRKDNFSYEGLGALFNYLDEIDEDMELDVIALCCEYAEYQDLFEFQQNYSSDFETIGDIEQRTTVIMIDECSFIIQNF